MLEQNRKLTDVGDVKIHNNAVRSITEITVLKVKGVVRINANPFSRMMKKINAGGLFNSNEGIKIETGKAGTKITLYIVTAYGVDVAEIASKIQDDVRQSVESMTGISVAEVDVNVVGVEQT
ncbi:MAG: Asp23/Gls24 family envelope stress response protein [Candidatus Omnitrophica bacterium]|nr:Asp23/Gls24 family envelope stress response protein [Candidatus Omnitrophota bacterium]